VDRKLNRAGAFSKEGCPRPKVRNFSYESLRTGEKTREWTRVVVLLRDPPSARRRDSPRVKKKYFSSQEAIQRILVALPSFLPSFLPPRFASLFLYFGSCFKNLFGAAGDKVEASTESIYHRHVFFSVPRIPL